MADTKDTKEKDARIKAQEQAAAARIAAKRAANKVASAPREAKVALLTGIGILSGMLVLAAWSYVSSHSPAAPVPDAPQPTRGPAPPADNGDVDDPLIRRPRKGSSGGGGGGGAGSVDGGAEVPVPIAPGPLAVLKGLRSLLFDASHSPASAVAAARDSMGMFPPGALDGAGSDVLTNLQLAALRVAHNPVSGIRVVGQTANLGGMTYDVEIVSVDRKGNEVVSRSRVSVEPSGNGAYRLSQIDAPAPFDDPGEGAAAGVTGAGARAVPDQPSRPTAAIAPARSSKPSTAENAETPPGTGFPYVIQ